MSEIFVFFGLLWFLMAVGTTVHAINNQKTPLWGGVVFIAGIFGLLFYAISLASD